jgi:hypothetical protein
MASQAASIGGKDGGMTLLNSQSFRLRFRGLAFASSHCTVAWHFLDKQASCTAQHQEGYDGVLYRTVQKIVAAQSFYRDNSQLAVSPSQYSRDTLFTVSSTQP